MPSDMHTHFVLANTYPVQAMDLNATDSDDDSTGGSGGDAENGNADDLCNEVQGSNLLTEDWRKNNFSCAPM